MQEHHYFVDIDASVDELWQLFWARIPHTETGDVSIDILYPGNDIGDGLIRHCTFRVPRYLLTGGKGQSWEWLTEVTPKESWKYTAVGRPLLSQAEGFTRLEDLGDGRTRVHFSETYHAFNPLLRALLEKRVHAFISKDNDQLIKESLTKGVGYLRAARAKAAAKAPPSRPTPSSRDGRRPLGQRAHGKAAEAFLGQAGNEGIPELLGGDLSASSTLKQLLATMDACGVDVGVIAAGIAAEETGRAAP